MALCATVLTAWAQPAPHIAYVYPAGGKVGSTFQIIVGGQGLASASNAFFSGEGIEAVALAHNRPMNQNDFNKLRDRLKELQDKFQASRKGNATGTSAWTAADAQEREQIHAKILKNPPNRTANPAMIDTVTFKVTLASNTPPGDHEIRLATPNALSNPLKFLVGKLTETTKPAAKPTNPDGDKFLEKIGGRPAPVGTPKYEARISLPAVINGQIMPGGVDRYRFEARRGQQIVIAASARALIPYLADAVPGWFETTLTVLDSKGKELASEERFRFKPDPVLHFEAPRDGEYTLEIHDSIFRGREDFIYRIAIGELPFVTSIFPPGGKTGAKTKLTLTGWNLPQTETTVDHSSVKETGITPINVGAVNEVPFALNDLPEIIEAEAGNSPARPQTVELPIIINGHISKPGEMDVFKIQGRAGQQVVAEVLARRLDSPLDSFVRLTDVSGKIIAFNDDFDDKGSGLNTHHADSFLLATLPADGTYLVQLSDTQNQGSPAHAYRLRLSEPRPDFALRVGPASVSVRAGMSTPLTAFAVRRDGFTNAIDLNLWEAPLGFSLSGAKIPANQDKIQFTLKAPAQVNEKTAAISVEGHARINGHLITHPAIPAEDMMQAFIYRHLVPTEELLVMIAGQPRPFAGDAFKIISPTPVKIRAGETSKIRISTPFPGVTERFRLKLENPPEGISLEKVTATNNVIELTLANDPDKIQAGTDGNLILEIIPNKAGTGSKKGKGTATEKSLASLPAVPFQCVAK
jgi:hypothetical protein